MLNAGMMMTLLLTGFAIWGLLSLALTMALCASASKPAPSCSYL
jgi:hypothetical protein